MRETDDLLICARIT